MHYIWGWASQFLLLCLASAVFAEDDPDYKPWSNFRPNNVTGLNQLYSWVGSYYNGTTEVELNPTIGYSQDDPVCPNQKNRTTILKFESQLAITQRGTYNTGLNSVNLWLIMFPPNQNISELPYQNEIFGHRSKIMFPLLSSPPTWKNRENTTVHDRFNMTTTKYRESFTLKGVVYNNIDRSASASLQYDINTPACNSSREYGNWTMRVPERPSWDTENWDDFDVPIMRAGFSAQAASLVMDGSFVASPYLRENVSNYIGPQMVSRTTIRGNIQVRFDGIFDAYHSDILDINSTTPAWLRTVGFGNNSLNIADSSGERHVRSALWSALGVPFLVAAIIYM